MVTTAVRRSLSLVLAGAAVFGSVSCGEVASTGRSPVYLVIESLEAATGNDTQTFSSFLLSDVETFVNQTVDGEQIRVPSVFNDVGRASLRIALKNIGTPTQPLGPTSLNDVTVTRYRVVFRRADGRNTPGVDVPYGFDGGSTITISGLSSSQIGFDLVRHTNKLEPPLRNLRGAGGANQINTIAEITFFGHDQAGNELQVTGTMTVLFSDFGDPAQ